MQYLSTRGGEERLTFEDAVLTGLAPNGGLYIPEQVPALPADWQSAWADASFVDLSVNILSLFIPESEAEGGIPRKDLRALVEKSYASFRTPEVTPLRRLTDQTWCLELWHGPTFAFKDVALQLLGNLFEYFLTRRNARDGQTSAHTITVLGATSGDTGSAAIAGLRSKANVHIFILHPDGRVSPIQEAQMTTVLDENVHNLAVDGTFDDCQDVVKALFSDREFNGKHHLGAVNSINWARILSQIVYYFSAFFALRRMRPDTAMDEVEYIVPTGNFGDILAGYYAKRLGLPMRRLVVATNENDLLQRVFTSGTYEKLTGEHGGVHATLSPAMDIQVSSNFERLLWHLVHDTATQAGAAETDAARTAGDTVAAWMQQLKATGRIAVSPEQFALAKRDFVAERVSDPETRATIRRYFESERESTSYLLDPHTAVGFEAADRLIQHNSPAQTQVVLSTAHPAKFTEAVISSIAAQGDEAQATRLFNEKVLPPEMHGLLERERRVTHVRPADTQAQGDHLHKLIARTKEVIEQQGFHA